jgi:hypothetical protein
MSSDQGGEQSESRDRRIKSVSGSQPKRHKQVGQRGSVRELEELRIQRENFRERLLEITIRHAEDHTSCLVVTAT